MIRYFFVLVCVVGMNFVAAESNASPRQYPLSPIVQKQMHDAIDDVIEQRYDAAFRRADTIAMHSNGPEAWATRALILHGWIIDYESFNRVNEFTAACDSAEERAGSIKSTYPGFANLCLGLIDGFRAAIAMRQEKWISAMHASLSMKSELEAALYADSSLTDSYVGLGSFDYWSSRKLNFLPFLGDHRERGIQRIKIALRSSQLHPASAATALIWIYIERGDNVEALSMSEEWIHNYPEARSFLWAAAEAAYAMSDWKKGIAYYQRILASVRADPAQGNHLNEMGCYHRLAAMSMKLGDTTAARQYVQSGLSLTLTSDIKARKKKDLSDFTRWSKEWSGTITRE
jgi:hypothetical protein